MLYCWVLFVSRVQCKAVIASSDLLFECLHGDLYQAPPDAAGHCHPSFVSWRQRKKRLVGYKWVLCFCPEPVKSCFPLSQNTKPHFSATHQTPVQVICVTGGWSVQSQEVIADPGMPWFGIKSKPAK